MKTKEKTTRMAFTADEIETLYIALNSYAVQMMEQSATWANCEARIARGGDDIWAQHAIKAGRLQSRMYHAEKRLEQ